MKPLIFIICMTGGGAIASLFRPYIGFLIYVCFAIIKPDALWGWAIPQAGYSRYIGIALFVGWILNGCGRWQLKRATPIVFALIGFWVLLFLEDLVAPNQDLAWGTFEPLSKVFVPWLVGISLIDSRTRLLQLAWVIAISQGYLAYEFNLLYYSGSFIAEDFQHGGLDNNGVAITMVTAFGLTFFLGMHAQHWWQKAISFVFAALMAHVVMFSNSRGGMVALIITGFFCFLLLPKTPRHYLIFILMALVMIRLAGESVQNRFLSSFASREEGGDEGSTRKEHWMACLQSMVEQPLGVGPSHWPITGPKYGLKWGQEAHSTWLQIGAEMGLPGLFCLVVFYGGTCRRLWPLTRRRTPVDDPWMRHLARAVIASLVGFCVSAQFVTIHGIELPYYLVLIGAGVLKLTSATSTGQVKSPKFAMPVVAPAPRTPWTTPLPLHRGYEQEISDPTIVAMPTLLEASSGKDSRAIPSDEKAN
jgi:O-antigen ligase